MSFYGWYKKPSVAQIRARALVQIDKLRKQGREIEPVEIQGRTIARSFWGKGWCEQLESFSDYENRLPRGRSYVRAGTVCHLEIREGEVEALVSGTSLYKVKVSIDPLSNENWQQVKRRCSGQIGSLLELLQGKLSDHVMETVTNRETGLFPLPDEIEFDCSCPDWAVMCKHVAAVLYGIGARLDKQPALLFKLRGVDHEELIADELDVVSANSPSDERRRIADDALGDVFGIDISDETDDADNSAVDKSGANTSKAAAKAPVPSKKAKQAQAKKRRPSNDAKPAASRAEKSESSPVDKPATKRKPTRRTKSPSKASGQQEGLKPPRKKKENRGPVRQESRETISRGAPPVTGKRVAALRAKFGMTKAEFAKLIGVSAPTITNWEKNIGPLKLQERTLTAWRMAEKLSRQSAWKRIERLKRQ